LPKASKLEKLFGAASYSDIRKAVTKAEGSSVDNVIFNFDSPGGLVQGVSETGEAIKRLGKNKDTYAYTNGDMASAAYWLASQAGSIVASRSSIVGSIGVYVAFVSYGRALENEGIQANIFQAGKLKTLGLPAKDPTEEEKAFLQAGVDKAYQDFLSAVGHRKLEDGVMQGQVFTGEEALSAGLVDALQTDLSELANFLTGQI
jgi:signal peptide peptidase SppA